MAELKSIAGLAELRRAMLELPKRLDRRILNAALLPGAQLIATEAQARAPVLQGSSARRRAGTLRKAIRAQAGRPDPGMTATVIVRVRPLTKAQIGKFKRVRGGHASGSDNPLDPFYWRFLEFGTSRMRARAFLRPAFEARKEAAADAVKPALAAAIELQAVKLRRGQ